MLAANPHTVVVLVNGNPIAIDWLAEHAPAIVEAFEGGQAAGTALARVLLGRSVVGPAGVMPWTVYPEAYAGQVTMPDMSMRAAGVGRTYRFYRGRPTYPFGHGLGYTRFVLEWVALLATVQTVGALQAGLVFVVNVTNVGGRTGAKVVAGYVAFAPGPGAGTGADDGPPKQLFAMGKVRLRPGESNTVVLESAAVAGTCAFCSVDGAGARLVRPGTYTITVGDGGQGSGSDLLSHAIRAT